MTTPWRGTTQARGYGPSKTPLSPPEKPEEITQVIFDEFAALTPEQQLEALRIRRARLHPSDFNEYCFTRPDGGEWQQQEFHKEWHDELLRYPEFEEQGLQHKVQLEAFREAAKTEQVSIGYALWRLGKNPNLRIKIVSADDDLAKSIIFTSGLHIRRNERLRAVFPNLRPDLEGQWNSERLLVERRSTMKDASLEAHGVLSSGVGGRVDLLIFDDVCNFRNTQIQPAMKEMVITAVEDVWIKLATSTAQIVWLDTPWGPDDASAKIASYTDFVHLRYPVYRYFRNVETGEIRKQSRWPEKYSMAFLENEQRERPVSFDRNFLLKRGASRGERYYPDDVIAACKIPSYHTRDTRSPFFGMGLGSPEPGHVYVSFWDLGRHVNKRGRNFTVCVTLDVTAYPSFIRHIQAYRDVPYTSPFPDAYCVASEIKRLSSVYPGDTVVEVNFGGEATIESIDAPIIPFRTTPANKVPLMENLLNDLRRGGIFWEECEETRELGEQLENYKLADEGLAQDYVIALAGAARFAVIEGGGGIVI
jgi:hypothetical protein